MNPKELRIYISVLKEVSLEKVNVLGIIFHSSVDSGLVYVVWSGAKYLRNKEEIKQEIK